MQCLWPFMLLLFLVSPIGTAQDNEQRDENLYSSFGKRDPFKVPDKNGLTDVGRESDPVRKYRLESYRLRAVMRVGGSPQAMFEDPDGKSHVVGEGDRIGLEGAWISRIVNSEVIVTERSSNYLGKETLLEKVISLPASESSTGAPSTAGNYVQQGFATAKDADRTKAAPGRPTASVSSDAAPDSPATPISAAESATAATPVKGQSPAESESAPAPSANLTPNYIQRGK